MANPHNPNNPIAVRHRSKGKLVANHVRDFNKIQDICDLFGFQVTCSEIANGVFNYRGCKGALDYVTKSVNIVDQNRKIDAGTKISVWWPRNIKKLNGKFVDKNPQETTWINEIEQDDDVILECPRKFSDRNDHLKGFHDGPKVRVVIPQYPKIGGYSFLGIYEIDMTESEKLNRAVWKRIAKEFVL